MAGQDDADESQKTKAIRLNVPRRFYLVPGTAFAVGSAIGLVRGGQTASLQFLAENVHRPPTTVQGWYFYNKTKNYRVMLGGLKGAAAEGGRLGLVGLGWVGMEEGLEQMGWGAGKEVGAAVGTGFIYAAIYRAGWKTGRQMALLGLVAGSAVKVLGLARGQLEEAPIESV